MPTAIEPGRGGGRWLGSSKIMSSSRRTQLIDFTVPTPAEIEQARRESVAAAEAVVARIVAVPAEARTFANTLLALEEAADGLEKAQGRYGFMSYVAGDAAVRAAADELREALEKFEIE